MTYGWSPFREMNRLSGEMDRAFDHWNTGTWRLPFSRVSFLPARSARAYPLLNVSEDADAIHVEALAPSIDAESLEVSVKGATLTISGAKNNKAKDVAAENYHRNERAAGRFTRTIELPVEVDADKVKAGYIDGILTIDLPKSEAAKPKQIAVSVS